MQIIVRSFLKIFIKLCSLSGFKYSMRTTINFILFGGGHIKLIYEI